MTLITAKKELSKDIDSLVKEKYFDNKEEETTLRNGLKKIRNVKHLAIYMSDSTYDLPSARRFFKRHKLNVSEDILDDLDWDT